MCNVNRLVPCGTDLCSPSILSTLNALAYDYYSSYIQTTPSPFRPQPSSPTHFSPYPFSNLSKNIRNVCQ